MNNKYCKKQFIEQLLISSVVVFVLHYVATLYSLYWIISWYDIPMHFLGGYTIGLLSIFLFFTSGYLKYTYEIRHNIPIVAIITILFTTVIGLGWELWELFFGLSNIYIDRVDTVADLIMNTTGCMTALLIFTKKIQ